MKQDALDALFRAYYHEALLYTLSLSGDKSTAEDIVADAFFKALTSADGSIENFKAWLFAVCRNEFLTLCRRRKRHPEVALDASEKERRDEMADTIIRREEYRALYHAVSLLPGLQREVITLHYFSGLSVKDISAVTGKSASNVKVLLHRARAQLKTILEHNEF